MFRYEDRTDEALRTALLAERARAVADPRVARGSAAGRQILVVSVGGGRYGLDVKDLRLVLEARALAPLPGAPAHILGVVAARGQSIPVLDLRVVLGVFGGGLSDLSSVVVVEVSGERFGIAVQSVHGVEFVAEGDLEAADAASVFTALAGASLAILSLDAVLARAVGL